MSKLNQTVIIKVALLFIMSDDKTHLPNWLTKITSGLLREPKDQTELLELLKDAEERSLINHDALTQIRSIIGFSSLTVSDVMIPRGKMVTINADAKAAEALPLLTQSAHSRFPVLNDSHDEVVGILLAKDMLPILMNEKAQDTEIRTMMRPAIFVPESKHLDALLNEFRTNRAHMAIVVDEYGAIAGLITIEDILEEIVGEIIDETDKEIKPLIKALDDHTFEVDALITIEEFNAFFNSHFSDEHHDTLAGLICEKAGSLPNISEVIQLGSCHCEIIGRNERRLTKIKVTHAEKK